MNNKFSALCGVAISMFVAQNVIAADSSLGYPRLLNAAEIQKLYGEKDATIEFTGPRGRLSIKVHGNELSAQNLDAFNTLGSAVSMGVWKVDASDNKVCHEWQNKQWKDTCFYVRQTGADSYEYAIAPQAQGTKFTITY